MRVVFVGRDRVVWRQVVLYLVTLGIYRRVWLHRVNKELDGHEQLGLNHTLNAVLLCLPIVGPSVVAYQTAGRAGLMLKGTDVRFGRPALVWAASLVPILGNLAYIAWTQSRLNRFWGLERAHPEHGVEIDVRLDDDPAFLVELGKAVRESYHPGSRFDQRKTARREAMARRRAAYDALRQERAAVRAAGGSTPLWPLARPRLPEPRLLHVTCGRCDTRFDVTQDPLVDTPVVCPKCRLAEVLPSLRGDPLRGKEKAAVPTLQAECPKCSSAFTAVRDLHGPTMLRCPACGHQEILPAPPRASKDKGGRPGAGGQGDDGPGGPGHADAEGAAAAPLATARGPRRKPGRR